MLTIPCYSEFPVILLHYAPVSVYYIITHNYSQDHCQNNPGALNLNDTLLYNYSIR